MRPGKAVSNLVVLFLLGGIASLAFGFGEMSRHFADTHPLALLGGLLFFLSAVAALLMLASVRNQCAALTQQVRSLTVAGRCGAGIDVPGSDLDPLVREMNDLMHAGEQAIQEALLQAKELEIQLKVVTSERRHAEAIIYSISDAVLVTDPFDELVLANESAARTFEFDLTRALRAPAETVLKDARLIELIREMRQSDSRGGRRIVEYKRGDRTFKITLSCVAEQLDGRDAQGGAPAGVVAVLHDVTREKEVADMKNDFVSNVSHELRTPLASIKAYVEMLIDGEAEDEKTKREFYEVIQNEANRLSRLIDNILNISRIESGLVRINKQPQSLMVILKEAIEVITPQARQKQIAIHEQITPAIYQTTADKDMLYQAVLNLFSNAVKYTPEGGSITVQTVLDDAQKKVITRVTDTGVGIPPKDLPFVFDKFYRAEANNRMAKGTGLGLSLVKHIIETVHRGRIFVESHVGKGTTFGFELDLSE